MNTALDNEKSSELATDSFFFLLTNTLVCDLLLLLL